MIRRSVKVQLVAFALIIVAGVAYVGGDYIGISLPGHGDYSVTVYLPTTGGLYTNADVSVRGVVVGKVKSLQVMKNAEGGNEVKAVLSIDHDTKIPAGSAIDGDLTTAKVADLSAVGEQYIMLLPETTTGPDLGGNSVIETAQTVIPPDIGQEVLNLNRLLTSVNTRQLADLIKQLGVGFDDLGPILSHLIQNGDALTKAAIANLPSQLSLISDGVKVLNTQNDVAADFKSFAKTFRSFTAQLDASDTDLRGVIDNGIPAATQLSKLLENNAPILPTLLDNLTTFAGIQAVRLPDIQAILELYPADTSAGFLITPGDGIARFGNVTDVNSADNPCGFTPNTDGYKTPSPATAAGANQSGGWGGPVNLSSYCHGKNITSTQRGSRYAPNLAPGGSPNITGILKGKNNPATLTKERKLDCPVPYVSGLCGSKGRTDGKIIASSTAAPTSTSSDPLQSRNGLEPIVTTTYNPRTGVVTGLNGKTYQLGYDGPTAPVFGSSSWEWLLLAPTMK